MIVDATAYLVSLVRVMCAAALLLVVLPMFVWRNALKGKSYGFRFMFSVAAQNCFLINLVLLLGFLGILTRLTAALGIALFSLVVLWNYSDKRFFRRCAALGRDLAMVARGTKKMGSIWRALGRHLLSRIKVILRWPLWRHIARHFPEYLALAAAAVYNIWFMAHNVLTNHCVQFSDILVHQSWIYDLAHGTLFLDGIYPFGMHCIAYLIHRLFFLDLREVLLYIGAFQTTLLVFCVYFLARRIFRVKYLALIPVIAFCLLDNQGRFAAALPQEAGVFAIALCGYGMIGFLHTPLPKRVIARDSGIRRFFRINQYFTRRYLTADALLFMLGVALCVEYHFYTAIAACMLVFAIFVAHAVRTVRKQYWVPIFTAGALGVMIAVLPFAACFARGIPFQESMQWALSVVNGKEWHGSDADYQAQLEGTQEAADSLEDKAADSAAGAAPMTLSEKATFFYGALRDFSDVSLFGGDLARILMFCLAAGALCALLLLPFRGARVRAYGYGSMILYTFVMLIMGAAQALGIVEVIAAARASTFLEPFLGIAYVIPADFALGILYLNRNRVWRGALSAASYALCALVALTIFRQGWLHNYFDVNLAYYNEPDYLVKEIREKYPEDMFTVISTTDEYYQVVDYGFHENLSKFMDMVNGNQPTFKIPTPYVFIFVEKRVLQDYYYGPVDVSEEYARMAFKYFASTQDYYFQRAVLMSQAYFWAEKYRQMYPNTFRVFYEDDIYIAYLIKQNPYALYDFKIDYLPEEAAQ